MGEAARLDALLAPHAGEIVLFGALAGDFGPVDRAWGLLAASTGDLVEAERRFDDAAALCQRFGAVAWWQRTTTDRRAALAGQGRPR